MDNKEISMAELSRLTAEFEAQASNKGMELSPDEEEELFADFLCQYENGNEHPIIIEQHNR